MPEIPDSFEVADLRKQLNSDKPFPNAQSAEQALISYSHVFRRIEDALMFSKNIVLNENESLVAGCTQDSIGDLYWLGVQVNNIDQWRANGGFHRVAAHDPEVPKSVTL